MHAETAPTVDFCSPPPFLAEILLSWFDCHGRVFPWREPSDSGERDPYRVWVGEMMLQQTTTKVVIPYYRRFCTRLPHVALLAAAEIELVLRLWSGLGYYRRAHLMHHCAQRVMVDHGGSFPQNVKDLQALPGIGPYSAAAIAAIAFGVQVCPLDGNVIRVLSRITGWRRKIDAAARRYLNTVAQALTPAQRAGDFAEALMDLGATICTPRRPGCKTCPWKEVCRAYAAGDPGSYPARRDVGKRPERFGVVFCTIRDDGAVLMHRNTNQTGLLAGLWTLPGTAWEATMPSPQAMMAAAPFDLEWRRCASAITHVFTHFRLTLDIYCAHMKTTAESKTTDMPDKAWLPCSELREAALSTLMRKALDAARIDDGYTLG